MASCPDVGKLYVRSTTEPVKALELSNAGFEAWDEVAACCCEFLGIVSALSTMEPMIACDEVTACCLEFVETASALSAIEPVKALELLNPDFGVCMSTFDVSVILC